MPDFAAGPSLTGNGNSARQGAKEYVEGWGQRRCCWRWPVRLSCQCGSVNDVLDCVTLCAVGSLQVIKKCHCVSHNAVQVT